MGAILKILIIIGILGLLMFVALGTIVTYVVYEAITDKFNLDECDKLEGADRETCLIGTCRDFGDTLEQVECFAELTERNNDDYYCWLIKNDLEMYTEYVGICYGLYLDNYYECYPIENSTVKDYCILTHKEYTRNLDGCDDITGEMEKGICYGFVASEVNQLGLCSSLENWKALGTCYGEYKSNTGRDVCQNLEDDATSGWCILYSLDWDE